MGDEAGKRVGIGIIEGPKYQVRSNLGFLLQTAGSLLPEDWSSASGSETDSGWREEKEAPMGRQWLAAGSESRAES